MLKSGLVIIVALVAGCAGQPPVAISKIPAEILTVAQVGAAPEHFTGAEVRWGGMITQVENRASQTWVEVVSRELGRDGRPDVKGGSDGRFIASFPGFADPVVYQAGYLLTVVGTLEAPVTRPIGDYYYTFPVVAVTGSYLWKVMPESDRPSYPPGWWYYDPWPYFYRPYPYHPRYR